jgi:hypothetical protein
MQRYASRAELLEGDDYDYIAVHAGIAVDRRVITRNGVVIILDGDVILVKAGDGPMLNRVIAAVPIHDVSMVAKAWASLGMAMALRMGDTTYTVRPEAVSHGIRIVTPRGFRRAREAVRVFEAVLKRVQEQPRPNPPDAT